MKLNLYICQIVDEEDDTFIFISEHTLIHNFILKEG